MVRDLIVEEVRRVRHSTEKACGNDWKRLAEHYRAVNVINGGRIRRNIIDRSHLMRKSSDFSEAVDATERLTLEEMETLLEILRKRTVEDRRAQLKREIEQSERECKLGKCRPVTPRQIMREILM
jgi:hypothetical protein